ncbi:MAG: hypothetical protein KF684_08330 [Phycisphaeraceae bacterium]|nr:hypothetical protein [Phycisphaeraceae bacterium]
MPGEHDTTTGAKSPMGLTCNIDRRGRKARAFVGVGLLALALASFAFVAITEGGARTGAIIAGVSLVIGGAFCLFEAANAWCAVRAMGFRTKL